MPVPNQIVSGIDGEAVAEAAGLTVGKTVKQLKTFIKDRIQEKVIPYIDLTALKGLEENVDGVFLYWNELSKSYHLDMSGKPGLIEYRDLFTIG